MYNQNMDVPVCGKTIHAPPIDRIPDVNPKFTYSLLAVYMYLYITIHNDLIIHIITVSCVL